MQASRLETIFRSALFSDLLRLFVLIAVIRTSDFVQTSAKMQTTMDLVHHLDSESFKPFIESMGIVLLSVVVLLPSHRSQTFVPTFEKVSYPTRRAKITI